MGEGLDRVWRAAEALAAADAPLRERLKAARGELLEALRRPEQWPAGLLHHARSLERLVRGDGAIDAFDAASARQVAEDFLALAADVAAFAERARVVVPKKEVGRVALGRSPLWLRTPRSTSPPSATTSPRSATT